MTSSDTVGVGAASNAPDLTSFDLDNVNSDTFKYHKKWVIFVNNEDKCGKVTCTYHDVGCSTSLSDVNTAADSMHFLSTYIDNVAIGSDPRAS